MTHQCSSCGASLSVTPDQKTITCPYCNSVNDLTQPAPPPGPNAVPVGAPATSTGRSGLWLFLVFALLLGGLGVFYATQGFGALREWYMAPCLVDANGDEVMDLAGWTGTPTAQRTLTVVDGRTGAVLWTHDGAGDGGASYRGEVSMVCAGPDRVLVARPDFSFDLLSARDHQLIRRAKLPDEVERSGLGEGCVHLETADNQEVNLALGDGASVPCLARDVDYIWSKGRIAGPRGHTTTAAGELSFTARTRKIGTALITVQAQDPDGAVRWEVPLNIVADDDDALPLLATSGAVLTWGSRPDAHDVGWLVGLDPATGRVLFERSQGSGWSGNLQAFLWNGRYAIAQWGMGLHAYDPTTGERVWHIGGR